MKIQIKNTLNKSLYKNLKKTIEKYIFKEKTKNTWVYYTYSGV